MKLSTTDPMASKNRYDVKELEDLIFETLTSDDEESPLLIFGAPGIGKTAILRDAINRLPDGKQWRLVVKTLSTETADNFFLPKYSDREDSTVATDVPKDWIPVYKPTGDPQIDKEIDKSLGKGLLFIDELSRAVPQVLNVALSLVHERIFNGFRVGSGWKIICASNRPEDEIVGQSDISNALLTRFGIVYFEPTAQGWASWAEKQPHISPLFLQWIQMAPSEELSGNKYFYWDPNDSGTLDEKTNLFCMPRTWDNAFKKAAKLHPSKNLQGFNILELSQTDIGRKMGMFIPSEPLDIFFSYLNTVNVVGDFREALDAVWHKKGELKIDKKKLRKIELPLIQFLISSHSENFPTDKEFDNFASWLVEIDSEQMTSYALDILYNVYAKELKKPQMSLMFCGAQRYKELKKENNTTSKHKMKLYDECTKEWCARWGWKNLLDTPNWIDGFNKLLNKYGETFANTKVEDMDAYD